MSNIVVRLYSSLNEMVTWGDVLVYGTIFLVSWLFYKVILTPYITPIRQIPAINRSNLLFGNMREIFKDECIDPYVRWIRKMNTSIIRYTHVLGSQRVMIADADAMKHIMVTHSKNYVKPTFLFKMFLRVIGNGLISLNGHEHLVQRKLCMGAFKTSFLKNMIPTMQRHSEELVTIWLKKLRDDPNVELEATVELNNLTLDMIAECGFGYNTGALSNEGDDEKNSFSYLLGGAFGASILRILMPSLYMHLPTAENKTFAKNLSTVNKLIDDVIDNKQKTINKSTDKNKLLDLLSMLMMAQDVDTGEGISKEQLQSHVKTFMMAGQETTATTMSWVLLNVAKRPEIQKRVRDEAAAVLPPKGQAITSEHLDNLTFLTCVIKETLRLYPAAPLTFRTNLTDDTINGYHIPAGTMLNINVGALHRNPAYWENPEEFCPERFLDEEKINPYAYLPFIAGPRMCIGHKFALMEMKITLSVLLRDLNLSLPNIDLHYKKRQRITMRPDPPLKVKAEIVNC